LVEEHFVVLQQNKVHGHCGQAVHGRPLAHHSQVRGIVHCDRDRPGNSRETRVVASTGRKRVRPIRYRRGIPSDGIGRAGQVRAQGAAIEQELDPLNGDWIRSIGGYGGFSRYRGAGGRCGHRDGRRCRIRAATPSQHLYDAQVVAIPGWGGVVDRNRRPGCRDRSRLHLDPIGVTGRSQILMQKGLARGNTTRDGVVVIIANA
jgi:hypothetical protein